MIESRRIARATPPSWKAPSLSGPRWVSRAFIRCTASRSAAAPRPATAIPQIPHMAAVSQPGTWSRFGPHSGSNLDHVSARRGGAAAEDLEHGGEEDADVERGRAVGDVLHVVGELVGPGLLAGHPRLREAGHAGADDEPLPVLRDLRAELGEEGRPDRARTDHGHLAAQHVPQLRHLVEVDLAQRPADPRHLELGAARELLAQVRAEPRLGVGLQGAELVHPEELAGAADPGA